MNSPTTQASCQILYGYANPTNSLQIIRVVNSPDSHFERVVFPGQRLFFEAPPNTELEVQTSYLDRGVLVQKIPGFHLKVNLI